MSSVAQTTLTRPSVRPHRLKAHLRARPLRKLKPQGHVELQQVIVLDRVDLGQIQVAAAGAQSAINGVGLAVSDRANN